MGTGSGTGEQTPIPALARLSMFGYGLGGPLSAACTFLPEVYRPGAWRILAPASLGLCLFSLWIAIRRRETTRQAVLSYGYAQLLVGVEASLGASEATRMAITSALGLVLVAGAMRLPRRPVLALMALAAVQIVAIDPLASTSTLSKVLIVSALLSLCLLPSVTVLSYRRQLEQAVQQVRLLAHTDPLTGLANRRGLAEQAPLLLAVAARQGHSIAVLAADLDNFKWINDQFGHAVGDDVLRDVAEVVSATVRQNDVVARIGGEELCVVALLEHPTDIDTVAERVRKAVEQNFMHPPMTVSVGAVQLTPQTITASRKDLVELLWSVLDQADVLLYEAKEAGRNAVRIQPL